jgi:DNA-3-methyladenine glycosylase
MINEPLPRLFFNAPPLVVARRLLGQRLVRRLHGELLVGRIVEVEAYGGQEDSTSHAYRGARGRAVGMYGEVGRAYIYLIYGMYHCLNVVAHCDGEAGAVLVRALAPEAGVENMREARGGVATRLIASGPGRLTQALRVSRDFDGVDLCDGNAPLYLAAAPPVPDADVAIGPRIGVGGRPEDILWPWRFFVRDDSHVSPGKQRPTPT